MTTPRSTQISLSDTPWYHIISRCVRRAFLCGEDHFTGKSFEHRRGWIEDRILQLAAIFAIDVAAYSVMSNHYHLVVRVDQKRTEDWSDIEILRRWTQLFTGPLLVQRYLTGDRKTMSESEQARVAEWVDVYRERLHDLSWFMRVLNESVARMANVEDGCTGRFWEGRFKSQALLDDQALLMAMSYVDLNPIRAGIAETAEQSDHTSVKQRIDDVQQICERQNTEINQQVVKISDSITETPLRGDDLRCEGELSHLAPAPLMPFDPTASLATTIPFAFDDYLELVDSLGRVVHPAKRGVIPEKTPVILTQLNIDAETFINCADHFLKDFGSAIGTPTNMLALAATRQNRYLRGISTARLLFDKKILQPAA